MPNEITVNYTTYSEIEVTNLADAKSVEVTSGDVVNVVVSEEAITPMVVIETGLQGPPGVQGIQGIQGEKGDQGDAFDFDQLTEEQKNDILTQFDEELGQSNYTNVFLAAYLA